MSWFRRYPELWWPWVVGRPWFRAYPELFVMDLSCRQALAQKVSWIVWWTEAVEKLWFRRYPELVVTVSNRFFWTLQHRFLLQNIQSTNWQTMRFKPPPANSNIGWRVEFRPMEVMRGQGSFGGVPLERLKLAQSACYLLMASVISINLSFYHLNCASERRALLLS